MTQYLLNRRLGGPKGRFGRVRKTSPPLGVDFRTVQPVVSRYKITAHSDKNMASVDRNQPEKILRYAKYLLIHEVLVRFFGIKYNEPLLIYCTEHVRTILS